MWLAICLLVAALLSVSVAPRLSRRGSGDTYGG